MDASGKLAAVIVGIEQHATTTIPEPHYCMNDARLMYQCLDAGERTVPAQTTLLLNNDATRARILELIHTATRSPGITGLIFYFAGHGLSLDHENYLVPWDGQVSPRKVAETCLALPELLAACADEGRCRPLIIVDACRRGITPQWTEARPYFSAVGLDRFSPADRTCLLLSTGPDKTGLISNRLHHGVFTLKLAEILGAPEAWEAGFPATEQILRTLTPRQLAYSAHNYFRIVSPWPEVGPAEEDSGVASPENLMPRLVGLLRRKRSDLAETLIREVPDWEHSAGLLSAMSVACRSRGELAEGERFIRRALEVDRHYSHAYLNLGNIQLLKREYCAAEESYQLAIRLDDSMSLAHYGLGTVECYRNNLAAALVHYLQAIRVNPSWAMPHTGLGYVYHKLGQVEIAVNEYRESIRLDPEFYYSYYSMGRAMKEFSHYQLAEANQRECLRINPGFTGSLYELGDVLRLQDRPDEARQFYQESLEADAGYVPSYYGLATLYNDDGQADLAQAELEYALTLDPTSARTHQLLADLYFGQGNLDPARHHAELAMSFVKPGDAEFGECQRIHQQVVEQD